MPAEQKAFPAKQETKPLTETLQEADDDTRLSLLRQVNYRIMEQLKQSYPTVSWLWDTRPSSEDINRGCTKRIKLYHCDPFNFGEVTLSFGASLLALCDRLVIYGDRISSGMKEEIRRARELGIPILNRQTQLSDGSSDPVIVGRYINGISLNGLEYLKNDADEVIYFAGVEAAKVYLREQGVTEDEMEDMVFRKSVGTCFRCGDPLFLSDIPEYTCQCFRCDEDFYSIEQDVDL